ncbi:hypothetical protein CROQUDRAFT_513940 [Cronartium quercuum f. sp. fusiforme G11]|uniref:Uncharacterized protein n=1 Tax=Cronartium quercuum f. sp. fusiforme G11 TaxID=708437 RepID=A0A9P6NM49_9BASI|nr:hypothetical protein CROQUDRAFT_513940 [Cronartium quercuum f. sp. fusiforme G11]
MLATAIAREREFDELLSQIRERERKRSQAFSTIVAKWAAQVPLPPDHSNTNSHAPTPTVHHTFAVFPSNTSSSPSTAKASLTRSSSPIRSPEPVSSPAVAGNLPPIPSPEPSSARSPVAKSVNLNQETSSADHQSPKASARSASVDHQSPKESARSVKAASVHSPIAVSVHSAGVASPVGLSIRSQSTTKPSIASVMSYIEEEARSVQTTKSGGEGKAESGNVTIRSPTAVSVHSASVASPVALSVRSQATLKPSAAYGMSKNEEDARSVRSIKSGDGRKSQSGSENGIPSIRSPTAVSIHSGGGESPIGLSGRSSATSRHSLVCEKADINDEVRSVRSAKSGGHDANGPERGGGEEEEGKSTLVDEGPRVEPVQKKEECVEKPQEDLETGATEAKEIELINLEAITEEEKVNVPVKEEEEGEVTKENVPEEEKVKGTCDTPVVVAAMTTTPPSVTTTISHQAQTNLSEKASSVKSLNYQHQHDHDHEEVGDDGNNNNNNNILKGKEEQEENVLDFEPILSSTKCPTTTTTTTSRSIVPTSINKVGTWYRIGNAGFKFMTFD